MENNTVVPLKTKKESYHEAVWKVLVAQLCTTLCYPVDCSPPGSSVRGVLQARILEWVAIPFSRGSSQHRVQIWVSYTAGTFFMSEPPGKPRSCNSTPGHISRHIYNMKRYMHSNVCCNTVYKQPRHGSNLTVHWQMNKEDVSIIYISIHTHTHTYTHIHNRILFSHKNEWNNGIYGNMNGPRDDRTRWSKPKINIWYHLYVGCKKKKDTNKLI